MAELGVVIPAYNYAHTLPRAIKSVLALPLDVELIVVDDGSTDETSEVVNQMLSNGCSFKYLRQENAGPAKARNSGIEESSSDFLMFLDADDELCQQGVVDAFNVINNDKNIELLITGHEAVSGKKRKYISAGNVSDKQEENFKRYLVEKKITMSNGSMIIRLDSIGNTRFEESIRNSEDVPFFALLLARLNVACLNVSTVFVYKHDDSLRHNTFYTEQVGEKVVDAIFSDKSLPAWAFSYEGQYRSRRCLSLFRSFYLAKNYGTAVGFYKKAIKIHPSFIFKFSYLRKFIKSLWKL